MANDAIFLDIERDALDNGTFLTHITEYLTFYKYNIYDSLVNQYNI